MARAPLVVVVPYHNEERYLPTLITSLRAQRGAPSIPVVFIDNASTDGSAAIIKRCDETRSGQWMCIEEKRVGKFFAMQAGVAFCADHVGADHIAFLDADVCRADNDWLATCAQMTDAADCGYVYSPYSYVGFDHLPNFAAAYRAYEAVLHGLVKRIGWFGNGQGFVCATDLLTRYLGTATVTTEIDLRLSLLALAERRRAYLNPHVIVGSARRIVVNPGNFTAWCFYDSTYYTEKDINAAVKLDLNAPTAVDDLRPDMVPRFFERQSLKLAARHLIPLVICDRSDSFLNNLGRVFGTEVSAAITSGLELLRGEPPPILSDRFDAMVAVIERDPGAIEVARRVEHLMQREYAAIRAR